MLKVSVENMKSSNQKWAWNFAIDKKAQLFLSVHANCHGNGYGKSSQQAGLEKKQWMQKYNIWFLKDKKPR